MRTQISRRKEVKKKIVNEVEDKGTMEMFYKTQPKKDLQ